MRKDKKKERLIDGTIRRLVREAMPLWKRILLSVIICCGIIACTVAAPKLLGAMIDGLYSLVRGEGTLDGILLPGLPLLAAVYVLHGLLYYANSYNLSTAVSRFFTCTLRIKISDKLQRLPVSYMDKTPAGDLIDRMQEDISTMGNTIHEIVDTLMKGFLQLLAVAGMMVITDWRLSIPVIVLTPLSILLSSKLASKSERYWGRSFEYFGKMYSAVEEGYTNFPATKAFNLEHYLEDKHDKINREHQDVAFRGYLFSDLVQPVITFSNAFSYVLIALVGCWLVVRGLSTVGAVVTIILFARQFGAPLEQIAGGFSRMQQAKAASRRVFDLLDLPEEPKEEKTLPEAEGNIRFDRVDFSYDPEKPLIRNLNMDVRKGQKIAIVGPTGAGKTTIVNLLMRFYDLQSGAIYIDGNDISLYSRDSVRSQFGMVLQDTWLFKGTVADNVAYGKPGATREEIVSVCDRCYCDHFIRTFPKGYDTVISEDTTSISAGQKQLLTIARAMLADRKLLILDEATSNVDTRTELLIQKAMDKLMKDRTCFVIAHRLSTIADADLILVIRDGQIVEQGTHTELLERKGFYHEIYTSQYAI